MRKSRIALLVVLLAIVVALFLLTPAKLERSTFIPHLPGDLDAFVAASEADAAYPLVPGTEKRIRWQEQGRKTERSIVYLHGFSGTRQELTPTLDRVADALGANLFETRLSGHGRSEGALVDIRAEAWIDDAAEAIAIGAELGEDVIVVGTSTGGALAVAMFDHPLMAHVSSVVLISPNFALKDSKARLLTAPAGPQIVELFLGPTRSFETRNERHARYWSSTYPTAALVEMMRLVDYANAKLPARIDADLLLMLSPDDAVVSPQASRAAFRKIDAPRKKLIVVNGSDDTMSHVLAGDILSPSTTASVAADIVAFIEGNGADHASGPARRPSIPASH